MDIQAFSGLFSLSHRVTVYVPGTCGVDTQADTREQVERVAASLSVWFGGATSTPCAGLLGFSRGRVGRRKYYHGIRVCSRGRTQGARGRAVAAVCVHQGGASPRVHGVRA